LIDDTRGDAVRAMLCVMRAMPVVIDADACSCFDAAAARHAAAATLRYAAATPYILLSLRYAINVTMLMLTLFTRCLRVATALPRSVRRCRRCHAARVDAFATLRARSAMRRAFYMRALRV